MVKPFNRQGGYLSLALMLLVVSTVFVAPVAAQSSDNFGIGSGHGLEVGINLPLLEQVRADAAAGLYDRLCSDSEHHANRWHTLVNIEAGCHYNHQHGDDPNYVSDIFGEPGAWSGSPGQSISYPWQTFPAIDRYESNAAYLGTGRMENEAKHEAYSWVVRRDQSCTEGNCFTDFRLQFHGMFIAHGAVTRWHSFSFEGRVCQDAANPASCGIVRHGGWTDYGRLFVTNTSSPSCLHDVDEIFVPLEVDTQYWPLNRVESRDEIRCHPILTNPAYPSSESLSEWWSLQHGRFRFQLRSYDPIGNVDPADPTAPQFHCQAGDPTCRFNASIMSVFIGYVYQMPEFADYCMLDCQPTDPDGDGRSNFTGFTDRFGNLVASCPSSGLDCVPIEYNNVTKNFFENKEARYVQFPCDDCARVDMDLSPPNQQWISWFYEKFGAGEPSPEPTPEPTGPALYFQVDDTVAGQVLVNLQLLGVSGVYGIEAECAVNPQILQGTSAITSDVFSPPNGVFFETSGGFQPDGTWQIAATRLRRNQSIAGDALAFTLNYNVLAIGDGNLVCSALVVDEDGNPLSLPVLTGSVTIDAPAPAPTATLDPALEPTATPDPVFEPPVVMTGTITGFVEYQNRPDDSGITVQLLGINNIVLVEFVTGADGGFNFPNVAVGQYTLHFTAPQHIPVVATANVETVDAILQVTDQLRAGDVDNNGLIDMVDVILVGANFGVDVIPEISHIDLNADGLINISDLTLVASNLDLVSPLLLP